MSLPTTMRQIRFHGAGGPEVIKLETGPVPTPSDVWPLYDQGKLRTVIHKTFPLEQTEQAHALMESSNHLGKIMLQVRP